MKKLLLFSLTFLLFGFGFGQTTIFSHVGGGSAPSGWTFTNNVTSEPIDKSSYWMVQPASAGDVITTSTYDLSSYTSATFSVDIQSFGSGTHRSLKVEVSYNGGTSYTDILTTPVTTTSYITRTVNLSTVSSQVKLRLSVNATSGRGIRLQNLELEASGSSSTPTLTVSPTTLTGFTYVAGSGPSSTQTFTASGSNLTANITLTAPTNYEISTSSGSGFGSSLTLTQSGGAVSATDIFVRLKSALSVGSYNNEFIVASSTGASNDTVTCSGSVTAACTTPSAQASSFSSSNITASSIDVSFTAASPAADNYLVVQSTSSSLSSNPVDATTYAVSASLGGGTVVYNGTGTSFTASGLTSSTTYYYFVFAYNNVSCGGGPKYKTPALSGNATTIAGPCFSMYGKDFPNTAGYTTNSGNAKRLASGSSSGSISTNALASVSGDITVNFTAQGWDSDENEVTVSLGGNSQFFSTIVDGSYNTYTATFNSVPANSVLEFATVSGKRVYIELVELFCAPGCTAPTTQASSASISSITNNSLNISWTAGSGTNSLVVVKEASAITNIPTNGTTYSANTTFGSGDDLGSNEYVVYAGTGSSVSISGLTQGTTYHVAVFSYTSTDDCYNTVTPAVANATTTCGTPSNVTGFATSTCENGQVTLTWTNPTTCFSNVLIFASETSCTSNTPTGNGSAYSPADATYGLGDDDLDPGVAYLVYKGTGTSVTVTGLTNGQNYCFKIFTRESTNWSSGVTANCTPTLAYCTASSGNTANEFIQSIEFANLNNPSTSDGYTDYSSTLTANVNIGETYPISIFNGDAIWPTDSVLVWIDYDGDGLFESSELVFDDNGTGPYLGNVTIPMSASLITTKMRVKLYDSDPSYSGSNSPCGAVDYGEIEDYAVTICNPSHTVTSIAPQSGPELTDVTISGTGFSASTQVFFNNTSLTVEFINSTTLKVEVPANAYSGTFTLIEGGCQVPSTAFTVIEESGSCIGGVSGTFSNLFISEIYDADNGNVLFVELFNPTSSAINLSGWSIRVYNNGSGSATTTANLTGTVAANSVFVASLGNSADPCNYPTPQFTINFNQTNHGINTDDDVRLYNGSTEIDEWLGPASGIGYSHLRKSNATAPATAYNASDWNIFTTEDCSDIGIGPVSIFPNPIISTISNITACEIDLSVSVTEGDATTTGDVTYQWYFNDGISAGWTAVSASNPPNLTILGEDQDNLLISSGVDNISTIDGYQFYCEVVEATSCANVSNAVTFSLDALRYYRSKGTGNWNNLSSWEVSTSAAGPTWIDACLIPNATNSDYISIENGFTITITENVATTPDVSADQLIVQTGGTLILGDDAELYIENGATGSDFQIEGMYIDASSSGTNNGTTFNSGATWSIISGATIMKTNTSSGTTYRDNYETGIAIIPADAEWVYRYDGTGNVAIANSESGAPMYYPNLTFESTSGNHDFNALAEVFTGRHERVTIKGDFTIGGNGNNVKVFNNNFNTNPILVMGDLYIAAGSELTNEGYTAPNGNYDVQWREGAGFELKGDALIEGIFDISHIASSGSNGITPGQEGIIFSGSSLQEVVGDAAESFISNDATINNSNDVSLSDIDMEINDQLTFSAGKIITDVTTPDMVWVKNQATAAIIGGVSAGASNYVEGKLQWTTDGSSTYTFPIGHAAQNAQGFTIDLTGTSGSKILGYLETNNTAPTQPFAYCDLETSTSPGQQVGQGTAGTDGVLDQIEYNLESPLQWDITNPNGGITQYDLVVLANGGQDISPISSVSGTEIRYLLKNGIAYNGSTVASTTTGAPSFSATGFAACPNQYTLTGMTSFSKFTLNGATQNNTTLPVELLYFDAKVVNKIVVLDWATATEINNDGFEVQRSKNGKDFEKIAWTQGAGNTTETQNYQSIDNEPYTGVSYYRLKQIDFDGHYEFSHIEAVDLNQLNNEGNRVNFIVYPNPFEDKIVVKVESESISSVVLYDLTGKEVYNENFEKYTTLSLRELAKGAYILKLVSNNYTQSVQVVKK